MSYRKTIRRRRGGEVVDPQTGIPYSRQRREVYGEYLKLLGDDGAPRGAFDSTAWAEDNDRTCYPYNGGISHPSSMAPIAGVSVNTLVNSIFPMIESSLHWAGPVAIVGQDTLKVAGAQYRSEQHAKQSEAGRQHAGNFLRWVTKPADVSAASNATTKLIEAKVTKVPR